MTTGNDILFIITFIISNPKLPSFTPPTTDVKLAGGSIKLSGGNLKIKG